ncbi:MAG: HopJ type III effector protein [Cocleimonas sp.]|nr:HopJ type III effector protein [Cocleimonas sp.]
MTIESFLEKLKNTPNEMDFNELMAVVDDNYTFTETAFDNGNLHNDVSENSGSCKLFSFAKLNGLSEEQTLACFGIYYRDDVLQNPEADNHQNIRNFMKTGWGGIKFDGEALQTK